MGGHNSVKKRPSIFVRIFLPFFLAIFSCHFLLPFFVAIFWFLAHLCTYESKMPSSKTTQCPKPSGKRFYIHTIYLGALPCPFHSYMAPINTHPEVFNILKILRKKRK